MKHPVELAAQFIRRADYVLANDVLRDEYGADSAWRYVKDKNASDS